MGGHWGGERWKGVSGGASRGHSADSEGAYDMHDLLDTQKYERAVARPRSQRAILDCCPIYTHANPRVRRDRACPFSSDAVCPVGFMHAALAAAPAAAAPATYLARLLS